MLVAYVVQIRADRAAQQIVMILAMIVVALRVVLIVETIVMVADVETIVAHRARIGVI